MVIEKKCSRCRRKEGDVRRNGEEVIFTHSHKTCDKCRHRNNNGHNASRKDMFKRKYPTPHDQCVYAFKDNNEIIYIGESDRASFRIFEHLNCHKDRTFAPEVNSLIRKRDWTWHILWYGDDDEYRSHHEKTLIQIHQPKFNKIKYLNYEK